MKVIISVKGRFHGFNLAQELYRRKALHKLMTTYPKFMAKRFDIPREKVISFLDLEIAGRSYRKFRDDYWRVSNWFNREFDRRVARKITQADLFIGWSGSSINSIRKAKSLGMTTVVERGSSHILFQKEILEEESAVFGSSVPAVHPGVIAAELKEYEEADYISIPSQFVKKTFLKHGISTDKLIQIPYGVNLEEFYPVQKEDNTFRFIHCGGITLRKGVHYLLQAFTELNLPDAELWMVGSIDAEMGDIIEQYDAENIIYHGSKDQTELKWFYSQCDVFCLASIEEGLAVVQAQAMACGLPIITSENTGGSDLIAEGEHGFTVSIRNVEKLKTKMQYMYDHQEQARIMGDQAMNHVKKSFTWGNYGTNIYDAYNDILNKKIQLNQ